MKGPHNNRSIVNTVLLRLYGGICSSAIAGQFNKCPASQRTAREYVNFTAAAKGPATESSSDNDNGPALSPRLKAKGSDSNPPSRSTVGEPTRVGLCPFTLQFRKTRTVSANYDADTPKLASVTSDAFLTGFAMCAVVPRVGNHCRDICVYLGNINNKPNNLATSISMRFGWVPYIWSTWCC